MAGRLMWMDWPAVLAVTRMMIGEGSRRPRSLCYLWIARRLSREHYFCPWPSPRSHVMPRPSACVLKKSEYRLHWTARQPAYSGHRSRDSDRLNDGAATHTDTGCKNPSNPIPRVFLDGLVKVILRGGVKDRVGCRRTAQSKLYIDTMETNPF